jgi:hypothetical protein
MKRALLGMVGILLGATMALAQAPERWFHIRVVSTDAKGEIVRVNVPMSVAEQVLPAIHAKDLNDGKVRIHGKMNDVDVRALLDAVAKSPDNEFVTVESKDENVRVAKSGEYLLVKVRDHKFKAKDNDKDKGKPEQVDIKVPISVVKALLSNTESKDELNVLAALQALKAYENLDLVTVTDNDQTVRIWVDSRNTTD